jgi:Flp pilus assembly protein TadB
MTDAAAAAVTLDRRVPLWGVIVFAAGLLASAGGAWAGLATDAYRIDRLEQAQRQLQDAPATLQRLDERTLQMQKQLDRLAPRQ